MNRKEAVASLEALRHWERLENLARRFALPHVPEYELGYFRKLYYPELRAALDALNEELKAGNSKLKARNLAWRGRVRRIFGDIAGALRDLRGALDLDPDLALAHAWLGECATEPAVALAELDRAIELDPRSAEAFLFRAAARREAGNRPGSDSDLQRLLALQPSGLGYLLQGDYAAAAKVNPVCSAAYLLQARAAAPADAARFLREAYNVSPVLGFITLQLHQTVEVEAPDYVKKIVDFAFDHPEQVGAYYQREATQTHYSHFPADDYSFVEKLVARQDGLSWAHAFFGRAACYTPAGVAEGERRLSRAIELCPHAGWLYAWRANARAVAGRAEEALADFAASVRLQPFYHRAFVWRGGLLRKLGRFPEALADLDRALAMDPFYSLTYHERSLVRRGLGDWVGAALDLDRAFMLDARYRWVFKTGRMPNPEELAQGLAQLDKAVAAHPSMTSLLAWRGHLHAVRGDSSKAFEDLERAVHQDPQHALAQALYGWAANEAGDPAKGEGLLARAVELEPRLWIAYGWLAEARFALGRRAEAHAMIEHVLKEKPKTAWALTQRARFRAEEGDGRGAIADLELSLLLDGKAPETYLALAQAQLDLGDLARAADAVAKCLEIAPNMGRAYLVRAAVSQRAGRVEQVVADYRLVRDIYPYLFSPEDRARVDALLDAKAG